jgi:hypothetical protein
MHTSFFFAYIVMPIRSWTTGSNLFFYRPMIPPTHNPTMTCAALWYWHHKQQQEENDTIYVRAKRVAFRRLPRWEPWNDNTIPVVRFLELFRMSITDFQWLSNRLRAELELDPLGRGDPLTVEAQVAVGLYRLAHGSCFVTIGHIFNIGKETADKASGRFVTAVLTRLREHTVRYTSLTCIGCSICLTDS